MKNLKHHFNAEAPLSLIRSVFFNFSKYVKKISVSSDYVGLCAYLNKSTVIDIERGGYVEFRNKGFAVIGTERSSFRGWATNNKLYIKKNATLAISGYNEIGRGSLVWILEGGRIELNGASTSGNNMLIAKERITIGNGCQIAFGVTICDHDFHKTYNAGKENPETCPITIGENVWIGMNAMVLKGVTIGNGAIVAAGAIVTQDVAENSMVAGIPARVIKENVEFYG